MIFNVAQLLKSPVGTTQDVVLDDSDSLDLRDGEARLAGPITGHARLHRTNESIVVDGVAHIPVLLECSRCLTEFTTTLDVPLRETFYPSIDIETGLPVRLPEDEAAFTIDDHHQIDLREAIRQNLVLTLPIQPLCREDCKGLCPECGRDLNVEPHTHEAEARDERFAALRQLLEAD
jgi:DUF177 domain-containing protein